jgi:hypothetical protein
VYKTGAQPLAMHFRLDLRCFIRRVETSKRLKEGCVSPRSYGTAANEQEILYYRLAGAGGAWELRLRVDFGYTHCMEVVAGSSRYA